MAKVSNILYRSKTLKDGKHPIMLRVSHKGARRKYSTGFSAFAADWDEDLRCVKTSAKGFKKMNKHLNRMLAKAEDTVAKFKYNGRPFSLEAFEEEFIGIESGEVFEFFELIIERLVQAGKVGNASVYRDSMRAIKKFHRSEKLLFTSVDYAFLDKWEAYLRGRGVTDNTMSNYMRTFRALINKAIKEKKCHPDCYPFKHYKISKFKTETAKRAISLEQMKLIEKHESDPNSKQQLSKDLFLFSFYNMGMNYKDIALLKWENIVGERIEYVRSKTGKRFSIKLLKPSLEIIKRYRQLNPHSDYIFPIVQPEHDTPEKVSQRLKSDLRRINKHLKTMAKEVGIHENVTFYVARHSWATYHKKEGTPIAQISEMLGHTTEHITQIYLNSFEESVLDKANEILVD